MLRLKDSVNLKELEKFGFKDIGYKNSLSYTRVLSDRTVYRVSTTTRNRYLKIEVFVCCAIKNSLQDLLFDLIQAGLVEKVEVE